MAVTELVAGVDGSPESEAALTWALHDAHLRHLPLRAVAVWQPSGEPEEVERLAALQSVAELRDAILREVTATTEAVVERSGVSGLSVTAQVDYGHPAERLIHTAGTDRLLVVGSRGHGGAAGALLGSVSQSCAQYAHSPVIVVRGQPTSGGAGRVVVGVDGSASSLAALRFAAEAAGLRGGILHVVHAWTMPYWAYSGRMWSPDALSLNERQAQAQTTLRESLRRGLGDTGDLAVEHSLVEGPADTALLDAAEGADLLVVGSRGRGGWKGLLLGSVSMRCITQSPCPVAVARDADSAAGSTA